MTAPQIGPPTISPETSLPTVEGFIENCYVLNADGELKRIDALVYESNSKLDTLSIDKGGFVVPSVASEFNLSGWAPHIYTLLLENGHAVSVFGGQKFFTTEGLWVKAEDLQPGALLMNFIYNQRERHLQKNVITISDVTIVKNFSQTPAFSFKASPVNNIFTGVVLQNGLVSLLPSHATV